MTSSHADGLDSVWMVPVGSPCALDRRGAVASDCMLTKVLAHFQYALLHVIRRDAATTAPLLLGITYDSKDDLLEIALEGWTISVDDGLDVEDKAAYACRALCRARVVEELQRRRNAGRRAPEACAQLHRPAGTHRALTERRFPPTD
jgi:hypothetical protein